MDYTHNNVSMTHITDRTPAKPKVSVIMLVYNSAPYLAAAISGVLRQKAPFDVQLVLSDDCSTDARTTQMCREYAERFPDKITLITRETNRGIPRNFLEAHAACKGEYIALCDADDYWCYDGKLREMATFMDTHPDYALCFHRVINYYEDEGTKSLSNGAQKNDSYSLADLCAGNFITNCSVLYRRSACPQPPQWISEVLLCDYAMHLLHAINGKIRYFKRPMAVYRKRSNALWTGVKAAQRLHDALTVREKALALLKDHPTEHLIMADNYTRGAISYISAAQDEGIDYAYEREKLLALHPEWTECDLQTRVDQFRLNQAASTGKMRKLASAIRAAISRLVPVPKAKPV